MPPINNCQSLTSAESAELSNLWPHLYPSDQQDIEAAVKCLPTAQQTRATYNMVKRTQPMPESSTAEAND